MSQEYTTICDNCYQGTWYKTEQPCKRTLSKGCQACGSHEYISENYPCTGTLRIINTSNLVKRFKHYHETGQRIEVLTSYGDTIRGYVGKTTGWKPVYMLLAKKNSRGSSDILREDDKITKTINAYRRG